MQELDHKKLKELFFSFFEEKKHSIIKDYSIVPEDDNSDGLFILAGMQPLIPYLMGEKHPKGTRIANAQRCIRTNDIEEVGDATHQTFFEMLGNWSLGDYFKKESITWSYEFLTSSKYLGIDPDRLWVSVFEGDDLVGKDEESIGYWKEVGVADERIIPLGAEDNWWSVGENGPCGPDTEIFFDTTGKECSDTCAPGLCECDRFVEIWNNVFMVYDKQDGKITELANKNVDTGMGLERVLFVLNNYSSNYDTSVLKPIFEKLIDHSSYELTAVNEDLELQKSFRILADHIRASVMIIGDENSTVPGNQGRSYIVRRLARRAFRYCNKLELDINDWIETTNTVVEIYKEYYPLLEEKRDFIISELEKENVRFSKALKNGLHYLEKELPEIKENGVIPGKIAFRLYDTYGFPIELTTELAEEYGLKIETKKYEELLKEHKEKSKGNTKNAKSGLAEETEETTIYHTVTHLLHAALQEVLGDHALQRGSNINSERLRFDFSHDKPMTEDEIKKVEEIIQTNIEKDLPITMELMSYDSAVKSGALGLFKDRYDGEVSVYTIGTTESKEICRGPHVKNTSEIKGVFKITKEKSSGSGVRRIKAALV